MLDQGRVFKVEGNLAWVEFASSNACAQCGACARAKTGKMVNEAENTIGARVGETVVVEISPATLTLFPLIAFGLPILLLFIGLAIGSLISETVAIVIGLVLLGAGILLARLVDKYISRLKRFKSRIISIKKGESL